MKTCSWVYIFSLELFTKKSNISILNHLMIKVLSIDGGGIRGIIPALILEEIEKRTGKKIAHMVDLISGSSAGGLLALGLTKVDTRGEVQYSATDLVKLFEDYADQIFHKSIAQKTILPLKLIRPGYSNKNLQEILKNYFGEATLKDTYTHVLLTAYEIEDRYPFFFRSKRAVTDPRYNFAMVDAALATSAAPTFFQPHKIENFGMVDGSIVANNPAMCAYCDARECYPEANEFLVVSLGTGEMVKKFKYDNVKKWGLAHWAVPAFYMLMDASSDSVDWQLRQLLPESNYFRFQGHLNKAQEAMDNGSKENMHNLKILAQMIIQKNEDRINQLCELLVR